MVMINTTIEEMCRLLKKKLSRKEFEELCFRYGMDLEGEGEYLNFEVTSDRIEIISKVSLAAVLGQLIGVKTHRNEAILAKKQEVIINPTHRPFVNLLQVKLKEPISANLPELLVMQDKFDKTVGRNRTSAAIGMFDSSKIKFPITYEETTSDKVSFIPLGLNAKKSYNEILESTEKGKTYGNLLKERPIVWKQQNGDIFALPPIINADFASVTKDTKNLLVDITGNNKDAVNSLTKALIYNLQFFGEVSIIKPEYKDKKINTELTFNQNKFLLDASNVSTLLGVDMPLTEITRILKAMDYQVDKEKSGLSIIPAFYRQDVIHQVDIVDDILRFYGVQNIKQSEPHSYTFGSRLPNSEILDNITSLLIGFGYQELDLNVLTTESYQFIKTCIKSDNYAPLIGQKSGEISMARANLSGEILRFISNNLHKKFPQKIFDIGFVLSKTDVDVVFENKLRFSICSCSLDSNISEIKGIVEKVIKESFNGEELTIKKDDVLDGFKGLFIQGRSGLLYYGNKKIGVIGEVHPKVLNAFKIELPVSLAEIYLNELGL